MENDKISVIVPVYNTAAYLPQCVESILSQTYRNLEILLVDDGSVDESGALCDAFARMDSRVSVIHRHNGGVSEARNTGIDAATGNWLAFVDSDDVISADMLMTLHHLAVRSHAQIAVCGFENLPSQSRFCPGKPEGKTGVFSRREALQNFISVRGYCGFLCNKLFRADLFQKPETLRLCREIAVCEDLLMTCQLTGRADTVAFTEEKLYGYVSRPMTQVTEKTLSSLMAREKLLELYARNGLPEAGSWYAYSLAAMLSYGNSQAVRTHFEALLKKFKSSRRLFLPELHSRKEKMVFYTVAAAPRLFFRVYSWLRTVRGILWKRNH